VIDAMTLLEVEELTRYWIDHPPPHLLIAAYLGIGRERGKLAGVMRGPSGNTSARDPRSCTCSLNWGRALRAVTCTQG
jgi:hypothetical protein